jgi:hypothetical protein
MGPRSKVDTNAGENHGNPEMKDHLEHTVCDGPQTLHTGAVSTPELVGPTTGSTRGTLVEDDEASTETFIAIHDDYSEQIESTLSVKVDLILCMCSPKNMSSSLARNAI